MSHFIFSQLDVIRNNTLQTVEKITEEIADKIPKGFNNNIRWHLGHLYVVQEKFTFAPLDLPMELTEEMIAFFAPGTSPSNWETTPPSLIQITNLLAGQMNRAKDVLQNRFQEDVMHPFTTKSGLTLKTVEQFLSFCLYHEGIHISSIKALKAVNEIQKLKE